MATVYLLLFFKEAIWICFSSLLEVLTLYSYKTDHYVILKDIILVFQNLPQVFFSRFK